MRWNRKQEVEYQEQFTECFTSEAELEELYKNTEVKDIAFKTEEGEKEEGEKKEKFWDIRVRTGRKLLYEILLYVLPKAILFDNQSLGAIPEVAWISLVFYVESLVYKWKQKRQSESEPQQENKETHFKEVCLSEPNKTPKIYGNYNVTGKDIMLDTSTLYKNETVAEEIKTTPKKAKVKVYRKKR